MRRLILLLAIIVAGNIVKGQASRDVRGGRIIADQGIYVKDTWIDSIMRDIAFQGKTRAVPTADAVYKYVQDKTAGIQGSTQRHGAGAPSGGLGINGDTYTNDTNKDYYLKEGGTWNLLGSLAGSATGSLSSGEYIATATATQTNFTPGVSLPTDVTRITVSRNGVVIPFTKSTNTIIILACDAGDSVKIKWVD